MDFLNAYGGDIKIKKQILKTVNGRLQLHKQTSQTCARIVIANNTAIPANTEVLVSCKIEQPALRKASTCTVEPANYLTSKGCFVARTLVNPDCENVVMSLVNLGDQTVKINQNSVLGKLEDIEEVYAEDTNSSLEVPQTEKLLDHLQTILENTSSNWTETQKQKLAAILLKYEDTFIEPDGELCQTDVVEHEIETGDHKPTAALKIGAGWTGPYIVVDKISVLTYSVQKSETSPVLNFSVDDLKPYEGTNPQNNWLSEQTTIGAAHEGVTQTLDLEHEELSPNEAAVDLTPEVGSPDLQSQNISVSQNASDSYGLT